VFVANEVATETVLDLVQEVCTSLFQAYGVDLTAAADNNRSVDGLVWCGVMGFAGSEMRGSVLLAGTEGPFSRSRPAQGELRDWVGELTNQLVGRLKLQLLERGTRIALSTPVVLQGEHVAPLPRRVLIPAAFAGTEGTVLVWVDVETKADFQLRDAPLKKIAAAEDDEALFF